MKNLKTLLVLLAVSSFTFLGASEASAEKLCVRNKAKVTKRSKVVLKKHVMKVAGSCPDGFTEVADVNTTTLPEGQTLRGYYFIGGTADAASELGFDSITFAHALTSAPTSHFIEEGASPPAECPGTAEAPEADPGHLCVFEGSATNAGARNTNTFIGADGTATAYGTGIFVRSVVAGTFLSTGTWAVTAPTS